MRISVRFVERDWFLISMVAIAQQVEHLIVVQKVARSNRVGHPIVKPCSRKGSGVFAYRTKLVFLETWAVRRVFPAYDSTFDWSTRGRLQIQNGRTLIDKGCGCGNTWVIAQRCSVWVVFGRRRAVLSETNCPFFESRWMVCFLGSSSKSFFSASFAMSVTSLRPPVPQPRRFGAYRL